MHLQTLFDVASTLSWQSNIFLLSPVEFEAFRLTALLLTLLPTCTVSVASWRFPANENLAEADRLGAKLFFIALLAGNLPGFGPLPSSLAYFFPAATLSVFGASALMEGMGFAVSRTWWHAAFRCSAGWWAFASLAGGGTMHIGDPQWYFNASTIPLWYFGLTMGVFWGHIGWCIHWTRALPHFRAADHYVSGCALVASMALAATALSPCINH